jgi:hypothetical protein
MMNKGFERIICAMWVMLSLICCWLGRKNVIFCHVFISKPRNSSHGLF